MSNRPNFLFVITDQHRADYLGCYGHPIVSTPQIDSLAARGRRFDRFYVASPICMANRATLMTGRMPSLHGVRHNGIPLSLRANTFVDLLRVNGYRTALVGKSHLQNFVGRAPILRRPEPPAGRAVPTEEFAEALKPSPSEGRYNQEQPIGWQEKTDFDMDLPFYGFEHVDLCTEHGDLVGGHYDQWLRERRPDADKLRGADNALPHDYVCPHAWRTAVPEELYPTSYIAEKTIEHLDSLAAEEGDEPFFLMVSFPDPHNPFSPPGHYWGMYKPADMLLPESFRRENRAPPPHVAWAYAQRDAGTAITSSQASFAVNEREAREAMALTCGMITMIDDAVGKILRRLERHGLSRDTVVVFTSDHGDYLGDHQLLLKGPAHYQSLIRVPFIWADTDGQAAETVHTLGGTLDIARTILDRAGIEPYNGIQGRDLLKSTTANPIDSVLIEEDQQRIHDGFSQPARGRTLVTDRWRLTIYHNVDWGELYNLVDDPHELDNLWSDPAHQAIKGDLFEKLARRQMALAERSPLPTAPA